MVCTRFPADTIDAFDAYSDLTWCERTTDTFANFHRLRSDGLDMGVEYIGASLTADPVAHYDTRVQRAQHTRKQHGMPVTHVQMVATSSSSSSSSSTRHTSRRQINTPPSISRHSTKAHPHQRRWYTLPYTTLADYVMAVLRNRSAIIEHTITTPCRWYCPDNLAIRYVLLRVRRRSPQHQPSSTAATTNTTATATEANDHRCFATLAAVRAYVKQTGASLLQEQQEAPPVASTQMPIPMSTAHAYRCVRVSTPFRIRPHPEWPTHHTIQEYRNDPPARRRVLTRKQYGDLHRAYARHIGVVGVKKVKWLQ